MRFSCAKDERDLADLVAMGLAAQAMAVGPVVYDSAAAAGGWRISDYDVLVLDRDLPG